MKYAIWALALLMAVSFGVTIAAVLATPTLASDSP